MKRYFFTMFCILSILAFGMSVNIGTIQAETITMKLAHTQSPNDPADLAVQDFIEYVHEKSNGRIQIENYPGGVLGDDPEALEMLQEGTIEMYNTSLARSADFSSVRGWAVMDAPFAFDDGEHMQEFALSKITQEWAKEVEEETGIRWLVPHGNFGARHLSNSVRPVRSPADLEGLTIRVHEAETRVAMIESWGASAVVTPTAEMYTAMQTGLADGQESPLWWQAHNKYWEVQDHLSLTSHLINALGLAINSDVYHSLSKQDQEILNEGAAYWAEVFTDRLAKADKEALTTLEEHGMEIVHEVDLDAFREATREMWNKHENIWGEGLIDKVVNRDYESLTVEEWQNY